MQPDDLSVTHVFSAIISILFSLLCCVTHALKCHYCHIISTILLCNTCS